jgi:TRAP-type C4-dicarboxylate transport system permease small subunit
MPPSYVFIFAGAASDIFYALLPPPLRFIIAVVTDVTIIFSFITLFPRHADEYTTINISSSLFRHHQLLHFSPPSLSSFYF